MNIKFFSTLALATFISLSSFAQTNNTTTETSSAHKNAHQKALASAKKSGLDKNTIEHMQQQEIAAREDKNTNFSGLTGEKATLVDDLLKEAATHIGKKYVWGSKGPSTFDCSGFTGYVYKQFGFKIGACSRDQYKTGTPVDVKHLRKGDLVFFTSRRSGSAVGHVGIVWEANNETGQFKFIHASTKSGVRISDFEGYYVKRYVGAKRVIE